MHRGGVLTVRGWLEALPDERVRSNGELAAYKGWALALTGEMALAEEYAQAAETCLRQGAPAGELGKVLVLRGWIALLQHQDNAGAIDWAASALQALREDQPHWCSIALWTMAEAQERRGHIAEAVATFGEARRAGLALGDYVFTAVVEVSLALALHSQSKPRAAMAVCEEAIGRYTDSLGRLSPLAGLVLSRLGMLHYEANRLERARDCFERGLVLSGQFGLDSYLTIAQGLSAPTLYAQGETDAALAALQKAYRFATQSGHADADWFLAWEANIHLQRGDLPFALRWAETAGLSPGDEPGYLRIDQHVTYGRLLIAQGRLADARRWLARLERFTQERGLDRYRITTHLLQALAAERSGNHTAARDLVARAIQLAAPEGYLRAFLDEGEALVGLLPEVRHVAPAFVDQLLACPGTHRHSPGSAAPTLVEPLSGRELEVLRLVAAGLKNHEIAQELVIAPGTVKRHLHHICRKLGASSTGLSAGPSATPSTSSSFRPS